MKITPKEFVRIWNLLLRELKKKVTDEYCPETLITFEYEDELVDHLQFVIDRVNSDAEFQGALARSVNLSVTRVDGELAILAKAVK